MTHCPDTDTLLVLSEALGWDAEARLHHMVTCADCRAALAELELLHGAAVPREPDAGFAARVAGSLASARESERLSAQAAAAAAAPHERVARRTVHGPSGAPTLLIPLFVLSTLTAWCALTFAQVAVHPPGIAWTWDPSAALFATIVGAAISWRVRREAGARWHPEAKARSATP